MKRKCPAGGVLNSRVCNTSSIFDTLLRHFITHLFLAPGGDAKPTPMHDSFGLPELNESPSIEGMDPPRPIGHVLTIRPFRAARRARCATLSC
jgi:hypothetical protein